MKKVLGLLLVTSSVLSMQLDIQKSKTHINPMSVFVPSKLGSLELYHGKKGFSVNHDDKKHRIQTCFTDPTVRNITKEQLKDFLKVGYFAINQTNNDEFSLKANNRINGGGPIAGVIAYWTTKSICWGIVAAATIGTVFSGGKVIAGKMSSNNGPNAGDFIYEHTNNNAFLAEKMREGITHLADTAVVPVSYNTLIEGSSGVIVAEGTPMLVSTVPMAVGGLGIGAVAMTINAAGLTSEAQAVTALGIAETAGGIGLTASIEALSLKVGLFFGLAPLPV